MFRNKAEVGSLSRVLHYKLDLESGKKDTEVDSGTYESPTLSTLFQQSSYAEENRRNHRIPK